MLPLMLDAVHQKKMSMGRLARIVALNPARAFSLASKGEIAPGKDADLVIVDMEKEWEISAGNRLSKCGWTPFEGKKVFGKIESTILRGQLAYDGESVIAEKGRGKAIG
jgi:dihydroorotase/allantoinase